MSAPLRILHLEDDPGDFALVSATLKSGDINCTVKRVETQDEFEAALAAGPIDLVLADASLPKFDGFSALRIVREKAPELPFILVSGTLGEEFAIDSLKKGATDYVLKQRLSRLVPAVRRAVEEAATRTERSLKEQEIRKREAELGALLDLLPALIWFKDTENNILRINKRAADLAGKSVQEIEGRSTEEIYPDKAAAFYVNDLEVIRSGKPKLGISEALRDSTGKEVWAQTDIVPYFDGGRVMGIVVTARDVTEQKAVERKLVEQASLLDAARDAIFVRDLEHRIVYWNKGAERIYGWTSEEAVGRLTTDLMERDLHAVKSAVMQLDLSGEWSGETSQKTKGNKVITTDGTWTLVRDEDGEPKSILCIVTDITERKKLEQQFLRAQRLESIGTLASGIAHDLNNVLAPILLSIQVLKLDEIDEDRLDSLSTIETSAKRGAEMVAQVLSFARGVEGNRVEIDLKRLLTDLEKIIYETFQRNIEIRTIIPPEIWKISGDPTQLHQVLLNLCVNARDAMPEGGRLTIQVENMNLEDHFALLSTEARSGPYVCIEVEDSGTGMEESLIEKIFDPFFTTKEQGKGTGLGLSTSAGIVKSHGGFINVYSEPGRGTQFKIYLPAEMTAQVERHKIKAANLHHGGGELVLVVDDETAVRMMTKKALEAFGYRVMVASDGEEALAIYSSQKEKISLVITDMMMPVLDGAATIAGLRKINPEVRIIATSGLMTKGRGPQLLDAGVQHFLSKPYSAETLLTAVRNALDEPLPKR